VTFPVKAVIPGWREALQLMSVGSKWQLFIAPQLAYGEHGASGVATGPSVTLLFEVELLAIK
jgi:FKBP-type peptidyl-prolyl cis-trans isomerase FklB